VYVSPSSYGDAALVHKQILQDQILESAWLGLPRRDNTHRIWYVLCLSAEYVYCLLPPGKEMRYKADTV